jgi:hypothetical protein
MKKCMVIAITLILLAGFIPQNQLIIEASTRLTLAQVQDKFPHGAYWNHAGRVGEANNNPNGVTYTPCPPNHTSRGSGATCNFFRDPTTGAWHSAQCRGFANQVAFDIYGIPYTDFVQVSDVSSYVIKPGDVLLIWAQGLSIEWGHAVFVTAVNGDTITFGHANIAGARCGIRWNEQMTKTTWQNGNIITDLRIRSAPYALPCAQISVTPPRIAAPSSPSVTVASASTDHNSARLTWNSVSGATSYQVQFWSPTNNDWRTDNDYRTGTSYISTGLRQHPSWRFRVRAVNSEGFSSWTEVTYVKPTSTQSPPSTIQIPSPPSVTVTSASTNHNSARLSWNAVLTATSYQVQFWSPSGNEWRTDTDYRSGTSYVSTGLVNRPSWSFRVRAVNSAGVSSWTEVVFVIPTSAQTTTPATPSIPTGLTAVSANADHSSARLSWNAVSNATSYQVQFWSPSGNEWRTDNDYRSGTTYVSTGLNQHSSWTFRVRAVNNIGNSNWVEVTYTKPAATQTPSAQNPQLNDINRNMVVNVGAGFTLRFCDAPTNTNTNIGAIPNNTTVYVYGSTVNQSPNHLGVNITWAKIRWNNQDGWVNIAHLRN